MASRFWSRYLEGSPLLRDILDKAGFFAKAAGAVYIIRENLIEFTVVRATEGGKRGYETSLGQ